VNALLLAICLFAQDAAREEFDRIEAALRKADSAHISCEVIVEPKGDPPARHRTYALTVLLRGAKFCLDRGSDQLVSDGATVWWVVDKRLVSTTAVSEQRASHSRGSLERALGRVGFLHSWLLPARKGQCSADGDTDQVSSVRQGENDGQARTLTYTLDRTATGSVDDVEITGEPVQVRVWYDPKTYVILKRSFSREGGNRPLVVTERFKDYSFNVKVPDELFKPPASK